MFPQDPNKKTSVKFPIYRRKDETRTGVESGGVPLGPGRGKEEGRGEGVEHKSRGRVSRSGREGETRVRVEVVRREGLSRQLPHRVVERGVQVVGTGGWVGRSQG